MSDNRSIIVSRDGSHTLFHPELNETYHSTHGAVQESIYVYINQGLKLFNGHKEIVIIEVGFGTGLNALLTWNFAEKHQIKIQYYTLEPFPLSSEIISELNYPSMLDEVASVERFKSIHNVAWESQVKLSDYFSIHKKNITLENTVFPQNNFHICYFDAFAPSKQAEIWSENNLSKIFNCLNTDGIFVTYCAQGSFKRALKKVGFEVEILPGPPFKKEMTRGKKVLDK